MKTIKGYKGFDKDMKCRGFQFEVGKEYFYTGKVEACNSGFHFCENPLDVLSYYPLTNGNKFASVEGKGELSTHKDDSKIACSHITIGAEVSLADMIIGGVKFIFEKASITKEANTTTGDKANAATTGNWAHAATTGNWANAATTGDKAHAATTGDKANAATTGDKAHAATTGNWANAATTGNWANAATTGNWAHAATTGNWANAATKGENTIAAAIGINSSASSTKGNWIVVSEYDDNYKLICVKTAKVDGKKIKENVFYRVVKGKFVEVK